MGCCSSQQDDLRQPSVELENYMGQSKHDQGVAEMESVHVKCSAKIWALLQLRTTPFKMKEYKLGFYRAASKDWWQDHLSSWFLAIFLVVIGVTFGYFVNVIPLLADNVTRTKKICQDPTARSDHYLAQYRNQTKLDEAYARVYELGNLTEKINNFSTANLRIVRTFIWTPDWQRTNVYNCSLIPGGCRFWTRVWFVDRRYPQPYTPRRPVSYGTTLAGTSFSSRSSFSNKDCVATRRVNAGARPCDPLFKLICLDFRKTFDFSIKYRCLTTQTQVNTETSTYKYTPTAFAQIVQQEIPAFNATVTTIAEIQSEAIKFIQLLLFRVRIVSASYCGYLALLIFVGPPLLLTAPKFLVKLQNAYSTLKQGLFVVAGLLVWFAMDMARAWLVNFFWATDLHLIIQFLRVDLCFGKVEFLRRMYHLSAQTCQQMAFLAAKYETHRQEIEFYKGVEATYVNVARYGGDWREGCTQVIANLSAPAVLAGNMTKTQCYWHQLSTYVNQTFPTFNFTCDPSTFMQDVAPIQTQKDLTRLIIVSGLLSGLLFQVVLATWVSHVWSLIDPLVSYYGRVLLPFEREETAERMLALDDEVKKFVRITFILPTIFSSLLLFLIVYNLTGGDFGVLSKQARAASGL